MRGRSSNEAGNVLSGPESEAKQVGHEGFKGHKGIGSQLPPSDFDNELQSAALRRRHRLDPVPSELLRIRRWKATARKRLHLLLLVTFR